MLQLISSSESLIFESLRQIGRQDTGLLDICRFRITKVVLGMQRWFSGSAPTYDRETISTWQSSSSFLNLQADIRSSIWRHWHPLLPRLFEGFFRKACNLSGQDLLPRQSPGVQLSLFGGCIAPQWPLHGFPATAITAVVSPRGLRGRFQSCW